MPTQENADQVPPPSTQTGIRPPTATPLSVYGNNAAVACPCGKIVVVRSMGDPGQGMWKCSCDRAFKGYPDLGRRITHIVVWDQGNATPTATYYVAVPASLYQS